MSIELDELPLLDDALRGFRYNRSAFASIHDRDYCGPGDGSIGEKLGRILDRTGIEQPDRVTLLTVPRILGYVFNPVSFYLLRRNDDALIGLVAEVRNTFGELHHYVLTPEHSVTAPQDVVRFTCAKRFFVSPFLDRRGEYHIHLRALEDRFDIEITLEQDGRPVFAARLHGSGQVLSNAAFWRAILRLPMHAASVMLKIHWQAFLLHFLKRVPHYAKPEPFAGETTAAQTRSIWHRIRAAAVARGRETGLVTHHESQAMSTESHTS